MANGRDLAFERRSWTVQRVGWGAMGIVIGFTPSPFRVEAAGDRLVYVFPMRVHGEPVTVTFLLQPQRIGLTAGRVGVDGGAGVAAFRQFSFP